jgi:hypothetical protein
MRTVVVDDYAALSQAAADAIAATLRRKPDALLLLATGDTPMGAYSELAERYRRGELDTSQLRVAQLDEYAWYYDNSAKPADATQVIACPNSCSGTLHNSIGATLGWVLGVVAACLVVRSSLPPAARA